MKETLQKFMTTCSACGGGGKYEEPFTTFGNETHYKEVDCGCENGKELDRDSIYKEIEVKQAELKHYQECVDIRLSLARKYHGEIDLSMVFNAIGSMIEAENKVIEIEEYISELEEL